MNNRIFGGRDEDTSTLRQLGGAAENGAEMLQRARLALDRDLRNQMLKWEWLPTNSDNRLKFQNAGEAFSKTAAETITLLGLRPTIEAGQQREQFLRPACNRYVAATTQAADALEAQSRHYNYKLTARQPIEYVAGFGELATNDFSRLVVRYSGVRNRRVGKPPSIQAGADLKPRSG